MNITIEYTTDLYDKELGRSIDKPKKYGAFLLKLSYRSSFNVHQQNQNQMFGTTTTKNSYNNYKMNNNTYSTTSNHF